jgi:DNA-binding CsgD family transcriptional regulator
MARPSKLPSLRGLSESAALVRFTGSLCAADKIGQLQRAFTGFGPLLSMPMYGFYTIHPGSQRVEHVASVNVSDAFVAHYTEAMDVDPLIEASQNAAGPVYNRALMSVEEWHESEIYRRAYSLHSMEHVVEVPLIGQGELLGAFHFAANEERDVAAGELRIAQAVADVLALSIVRIRRRDRDRSEYERAIAALEVSRTAVAWTGPGAAEPRLNEAARGVLDRVVNGSGRLYDLLARPLVGGAFTRGAAVELIDGTPAVLHAHSVAIPNRPGLVTVLELEPQQAAIRPAALTGLTPRESEVAALVVEGLTDREIAERLTLSRHTTSQHVRSIYAKLGVDSRVALTRHLIKAPRSAYHN